MIGNKRYEIILADPPWNIRWQGSKSIGTKPLSYPTMTMTELVDFGKEVKKISEDCSKLFMWTTNGFLHEALGLLKHWGFQYDKLWTWCKPTGAGGHPRNATEHLIEASRGALKSIGRHEKAINNWFQAPTKGHSTKPEEVYKIIEYCYPNSKKIELFARNTRQGWDSWGNQIKNSSLNSNYTNNNSPQTKPLSRVDASSKKTVSKAFTDASELQSLEDKTADTNENDEVKE